MEIEPNSRDRQIVELKNRVIEILKSDQDPHEESEPLLYNLGTLLLQQEQDQEQVQEQVRESEALVYFELAAKLNPNRDASWFNIAMIREAKADVQGSLSAYARAIEVTRDAKTATACFNNKVGLLLAENRLDEAARIADEAVNAYPDDPSTWTSLGVVLRVNGNDDLAVTCFESALARGPDEKNMVALNNLGMLYSKSAGRRAQAVDMLKRALAVSPNDLASLKALAPMLAEMGSAEEAALCLNRAIALDPADNQLQFQLSVLENTWPMAAAVAQSLDYIDDATNDAGAEDGSGKPKPLFKLGSTKTSSFAQFTAGGGKEASSLSTPSSKAMPRTYVADLFDFYAQNGYEEHMVALQYKGPQLLWDVFAALDQQRGREALAAYRSIELGVGTGACGSYFRSKGLGADLVGCDLSPVMVQKSARAEVVLDHAHELAYRSVSLSDAVDFLEAHGRSDSDLILAADVLCYVGDLQALFKAARFAVHRNGMFIFTVEELITSVGGNSLSDGGGRGGGGGPGASTSESRSVSGGPFKAPATADGPPYQLQASGRFAHSASYLCFVAAKAGFDVASLTRAAVRLDGEVPVPGLVAALVAVDLAGSGDGGS